MTTPKNRKRTVHPARARTHETPSNVVSRELVVDLGSSFIDCSTFLIFGEAYWWGYLYFAQGLPDYRSLSDYQPPQITRIVARDGTLIGEMYEDRRTLVSREDIPEISRSSHPLPLLRTLLFTNMRA